MMDQGTGAEPYRSHTGDMNMKRNKYSIRLTGCFLLISFFSFHSSAYPAASSYFDAVQKIYIGYYQRPADPAGLIYWAGMLDTNGGNHTDIIYDFANSNESRNLYGPINSSTISIVVNDIYNALLARDAEPDGLAYWVGEFNGNRITAATVMLNILNGAQNEDRQSINNKLSAANLFTRTIDPDLDGSNFQVTYAEDDVIASRNFLGFVTWDPVTVQTQDGTTTYLQTNIAHPGDPILSVTNAAPVANAGVDQSVITGTIVTLDGSASSDVNGDLLAYRWAFTSKPNGSSATLSNAVSTKPTFTADVVGTYVLNLVVNDGKANSVADTVSIVSIANTGSVTVKW
jgi:hypothetical protein